MLSPKIISISITSNPFIEIPALKFTMKDFNKGEKKANSVDVRYIDVNGDIFTNFDNPEMSILSINSFNNREITGRFAFKIRNMRNNWLNYNQGIFRVFLQ